MCEGRDIGLLSKVDKGLGLACCSIEIPVGSSCKLFLGDVVNRVNLESRASDCLESCGDKGFLLREVWCVLPDLKSHCLDVRVFTYCLCLKVESIVLAPWVCLHKGILDGLESWCGWVPLDIRFRGSCLCDGITNHLCPDVLITMSDSHTSDRLDISICPDTDCSIDCTSVPVSICDSVCTCRVLIDFTVEFL